MDTGRVPSTQHRLYITDKFQGVTSFNTTTKTSYVMVDAPQQRMIQIQISMGNVFLGMEKPALKFKASTRLLNAFLEDFDVLCFGKHLFH